MKLTIERLGHHGDGIARGPEGPVFVPAMLPGEEVEGELKGDRLEGAKIVTPSVHRRKAPCPHYRACGGCALQHAHDDFVAGWKAGVVLHALNAQGLTAEVTAIHTSPANSRRRATLSARRTKAGVTLGFHMRGSDQVIAVPECLLLDAEVKRHFPTLEEITKLGASRKGELSITITASVSGPDLAVTGGKPLDAMLLQDLGQLCERSGIARITWDGEAAATRAQPLVPAGPGQIHLAPGAFLQATAEGEAALVNAVTAATKGAKRVADLFAGCGTFTLPLALQSEVHGIEGAAPLTRALDQSARMAKGTHKITSETRDLFRNPLIPDELRRYDAVVIDPPRAGAEAQIGELARSNVPVIAMVSCNPVTFARDAKALTAAGYVMSDLQIVDQFRWATHVEMVATFRRG
ncbi:class I SAM-dependent RNA methyltransferase [Falsigemmobacter faecalis]|uniref:Class I SAM-dependent RNA methyltransferase n=1 Tax=Falsigemmobacter faecalis TaxID=2488730 RepID=A0A3P3DUS3_9RHOB|nr:class I SAM-dependent RNA methyltransferase [Falsigemmobacter faecalis]RRH77980.1 class I SAM-dependent RNA methyltransferase [Falsigemmobacter faecalis]